MRETPLSNCEKEFILNNIKEHRRLDGRNAYDYRDIRISFGVSLGCCHVEMGKTKVLAQVSCEVGQPKQTRPHDGVLFVNVELSPMASPAFEQGRPSEESVELSRLMERCLKESRCVDLESLCIVSGEKVWHVRVDIHVLNHEGNILDCSSIAAISALAHFKRPDVSVQGEEITIHPLEEKDPVGLSIHHMPLLVSFSFFLQGKYLLVDPSEKEEKVMDGKMVIGMNKHREICTLQVTGQNLLLKDQVLRCSSIAVTKVTKTTELIVQALENDKQARLRGEKHGFAEQISSEKVTSNHWRETQVKVKEEVMSASGGSGAESEDVDSDMEAGSGDSQTDAARLKDVEPNVDIVARGVGAIGEGGASRWLDLPKTTQTSKNKGKLKRSHPEETEVKQEYDEDSEEETQTVLNGVQ
ncbi:exosome complex component RRP45 [Aplysia californica]|uniref:Exosome complex component RRP45 n=1 Tax=Aplysia californica TaxID=6500 RepID=A0ABM1VUI3_APLCA|nr:exosome complex component RRP45 [Aplysia californica]